MPRDMCGVVLGTIRRVEEGSFRHAIVLGALPDGHSVSSKEMTHAFPLYVPTKAGKSQENFPSLSELSIDERYDQTTVVRKKFSATFIRSCMRRRIVPIRGDSCGLSFRACLSPRTLTSSKSSRASAGLWSKRIFSELFRAAILPPTTVRATTRSSSSGIRRRTSRSPSITTQTLQANPASRLGLPHRRLSGARQIP